VCFQEAPYEIPEADPAPSWPEYGVVKFDNYQTKYREGLDLVSFLKTFFFVSNPLAEFVRVL